jgi:hypothetical protein
MTPMKMPIDTPKRINRKISDAVALRFIIATLLPSVNSTLRTVDLFSVASTNKLFPVNSGYVATVNDYTKEAPYHYTHKQKGKNNTNPWRFCVMHQKNPPNIAHAASAMMGHTHHGAPIRMSAP